MKKIIVVTLLMSFSFCFVEGNNLFLEDCKKRCIQLNKDFVAIYSERNAAYNGTHKDGLSYQSCIDKTFPKLKVLKQDSKMCDCKYPTSFLDEHETVIMVVLLPIVYGIVRKIPLDIKKID